MLRSLITGAMLAATVSILPVSTGVAQAQDMEHRMMRHHMEHRMMRHEMRREMRHRMMRHEMRRHMRHRMMREGM